MNIDAQKSKKVNHKAEKITGLGFLIFLLWGCVYQMGHPWTCQQAREAWQRTQSHAIADQNSQRLNQVIVNRDTIHLCR